MRRGRRCAALTLCTDHPRELIPRHLTLVLTTQGSLFLGIASGGFLKLVSAPPAPSWRQARWLVDCTTGARRDEQSSDSMGCFVGETPSDILGCVGQTKVELVLVFHCSRSYDGPKAMWHGEYRLLMPWHGAPLRTSGGSSQAQIGGSGSTSCSSVSSTSRCTTASCHLPQPSHPQPFVRFLESPPGAADRSY